MAKCTVWSTYKARFGQTHWKRTCGSLSADVLAVEPGRAVYNVKNRSGLLKRGTAKTVARAKAAAARYMKSRG